MEEEIIQVVETRGAPMEEKCWEVYVDRESNAKGESMVNVNFNTKEGMIEQNVRITFLMTNNVA